MPKPQGRCIFCGRTGLTKEHIWADWLKKFIPKNMKQYTSLSATIHPAQATVAEMCKLIEWPDYDQADAFRLNKVINEPDFLPLYVVRQLAQAATLVRVQRGKLVATPLGKSILSDTKQGALLAVLFHLAFWHMDLSYFGRGVLGSWPQADAGVVLWSLSVCADEWQSAEKLTRLCTIPEPATCI